MPPSISASIDSVRSDRPLNRLASTPKPLAFQKRLPVRTSGDVARFDEDADQHPVGLFAQGQVDDLAHRDLPVGHQVARRVEALARRAEGQPQAVFPTQQVGRFGGVWKRAWRSPGVLDGSASI